MHADIQADRARRVGRLDGEAAGRENSRRLLVRLALDLHDGPLQETAALGNELHFFRHRLATDFGEQAPAVQHTDDLIRQVADLADHLRDLAVSASSPVPPGSPMLEPLSDALAATAELYADSCDVELVLEPSSAAVDSAVPTDSQRIAILRVVQGALANVAQHSGAYLARVTVRSRLDGVTVEVWDNGCGFDVEARQRASELDGHLGLAGMRKRVELLDGVLQIESRRGGPTCLRAVLPRWRPPGC